MTTRTQSEQPGSSFVKKEIMYAVAAIAVVIGFVGGVIYSSFSSAPIHDQHNHQAAGPAQQSMSSAPPQMTQEQASAILNLENEVSKNPKNAAAWTDLANLYYDTDKADKAIKAYTKSLELVPDNPDVLTDMGVMYRRAGQHQKAIESFDKASSINPSHQQALFNKGIVYLHDLNDVKKAANAWEDLLKINPNATAPTGQPIKEMVEELKKRG